MLRTFFRRPRLRTGLAALVCALCCSLAAAQTLSLTFDDGLNPDKEPRAAAWNQALLDGLQRAGVTAMVFPSLARTGGAPGLALIRAWGDAGHAVGNHTASHRSLAAPDVSLAAFTADIATADAALRTLPGWRPMLRFPYLKEGDTLAKRDGVRAWLAAHGYRAAPVSVDASDWYYNQVYGRWLDEGAPHKAQQVKAAYVDHLLDRAQYYDQLARRVLGRSPPHVLLVHTSRLNADAIGDVVQAFRARGWTFTSPLTALADPLYTEPVDTLPAGESVVWAHTRAQGVTGLRYPAEDDVYEAPKLRALGLLPDAAAQPAPSP